MLKKTFPLVFACMALVACGGGEDEAKSEKPVDIKLPGLSVEADESGIEIKQREPAEPEAVEPEAMPEEEAKTDNTGGYKIEADENGVTIESPEGKTYEYPKKSEPESMMREL